MRLSPLAPPTLFFALILALVIVAAASPAHAASGNTTLLGNYTGQKIALLVVNRTAWIFTKANISIVKTQVEQRIGNKTVVKTLYIASISADRMVKKKLRRSAQEIAEEKEGEIRMTKSEFMVSQASSAVAGSAGTGVAVAVMYYVVRRKKNNLILRGWRELIGA